MKSETEVIEQEIINNISQIIIDTNRSLKFEERYPMGDADRSDEKIGMCRVKIEKLRSIRNELENIFADRI